jgi:hypothetical protein
MDDDVNAGLGRIFSYNDCALERTEPSSDTTHNEVLYAEEDEAVDRIQFVFARTRNREAMEWAREEWLISHNGCGSI